MWVGWIKAWTNTSMNPKWICVYMDPCASSESNKCKANRAPLSLSVFRRKWGPICCCPTLLMQKICQIVCRVSTRWMESNFLDQDVDVVFLANKSIVIRCFVGRKPGTITKFSWRRKVHEQHQGHEKWTRIWCWQNVSDVGFFVLPLHWSIKSFRKECRVRHPLSWPIAWHTFHIHDNIKVLVPWKWTGSLNFGPLRKISLNLSFCTILRSPVTTWPHGAYRNSEQGQVQGREFWERLLKSICRRLLLELKKGYSDC